MRRSTGIVANRGDSFRVTQECRFHAEYVFQPEPAGCRSDRDYPVRRSVGRKLRSVA